MTEGLREEARVSHCVFWGSVVEERTSGRVLAREQEEPGVEEKVLRACAALTRPFPLCDAFPRNSFPGSGSAVFAEGARRDARSTCA
jgi:hypothetical protein